MPLRLETRDMADFSPGTEHAPPSANVASCARRKAMKKKSGSPRDLEARKNAAAKVNGGAAYTTADLAADVRKSLGGGMTGGAATSETLKAIGNALQTSARG
jgi:hypothetical protein